MYRLLPGGILKALRSLSSRVLAIVSYHLNSPLLQRAKLHDPVVEATLEPWYRRFVVAIRQRKTLSLAQDRLQHVPPSQPMLGVPFDIFPFDPQHCRQFLLAATAQLHVAAELEAQAVDQHRTLGIADLSHVEPGSTVTGTLLRYGCSDNIIVDNLPDTKSVVGHAAIAASCLSVVVPALERLLVAPNRQRQQLARPRQGPAPHPMFSRNPDTAVSSPPQRRRDRHVS